ncbi:MAG TPA: hypothetical protein VFU21_19535 [Kofleriaceae bacterium]|nr:hypothetical protein [Kofleriaceae bacterium]
MGGFRGALLIAWAAAACAQGSGGSVADGGPAGSDGAPGGATGVRCDGDQDCASGHCLDLSAGAVCTDTCDGDGECPEGWSCVGVIGVESPDIATPVCVPDGPLCASCEVSTACAQVGSDLCVTDSEGDGFCARDCSAVGCPAGYACREMDGGAQQCVPQSGACDCRFAEDSGSQPCVITTPDGACAGVRSCLGVEGWSECEAAEAADEPDDAYVDANCDGIDGVLADGILVAPGGDDAFGCGMDLDAVPCATIQYGMERAQASDRSQVFIQAGTYDGPVVMKSGVSLVGGYDIDWRRGPASDALHQVVVRGGWYEDGQRYVVIRAYNLGQPVALFDMVLVAADASGTAALRGRTSYAVHLSESTMTMQGVVIEAGSGADGARGSDGEDAASPSGTSAQDGTDGGPANEFSTACNSSSRGARGVRGTNTCGSDTYGGSGGRGGTMDEDCSGVPDLSATPGEAGSSAIQVATGSYGYRGDGGVTCGIGRYGRDGRVQNGAAGSAGTGAARIGLDWWGVSGGSGGLGQDGGGGGGGGGSGGCDDGTDSYGAGGGGGGAGGCRAPAAATGGGGGGSSVGIFSFGSTLVLTGCAIQRGAGGDGGAGGTGGRGQSGGSGGLGGPGEGDSEVGGDGGDGGHGGHGGGGGGGAGGHSIGIVRSGGSLEHDCVFTGGAAGAGGSGGASAPGAPIDERDGNPGASGTTGGIFDVLVAD